ncbi:hypothetical protein EDD22DRAFT_958292 [Suillus occidentalis]|nr:hypothetical protein EDD22DRAFT_958292 [Suillus occidentalis]
MLSTDPPSPPTTLSVLRSEPGNYHTGALTDATIHMLRLISHQSLTLASCMLCFPARTLTHTGLLQVGQEVGIFFHWLDIGEHTQGISRAIQVRQETWVDALRLYTRKYNEGAVEARPHVGSCFWPPCVPHTAPSAPASPVSSTHSSKDSIWTHVEDLSEQMSQVTRY